MTARVTCRLAEPRTAAGGWRATDGRNAARMQGGRAGDGVGRLSLRWNRTATWTRWWLEEVEIRGDRHITRLKTTRRVPVVDDHAGGRDDRLLGCDLQVGSAGCPVPSDAGRVETLRLEPGQERNAVLTSREEGALSSCRLTSDVTGTWRLRLASPPILRGSHITATSTPSCVIIPVATRIGVAIVVHSSK
jgi:hypothetical protein